MINTREHWCKACTTTFYVNLGERFTGDVFLVCPACRREHFRHFEMGSNRLGDLKNDLRVGFRYLRESRNHGRSLPVIKERLQPID